MMQRQPPRPRPVAPIGPLSRSQRRVRPERSLRERLHLTQGALAKLLRLGANTISRWEAGRNVQTAAIDMFLRLIRDLPGSIQYLRKHAA